MTFDFDILAKKVYTLNKKRGNRNNRRIIKSYLTTLVITLAITLHFQNAFFFMGPSLFKLDQFKRIDY